MLICSTNLWAAGMYSAGTNGGLEVRYRRSGFRVRGIQGFRVCGHESVGFRIIGLGCTGPNTPSPKI